MIPGKADHYVCVGSIMGHETEFTYDGWSPFEVESNTIYGFPDACHAAVDNRSDARDSNDISNFTCTHLLDKPTWQGPFWKYMDKLFS